MQQLTFIARSRFISTIRYACGLIIFLLLMGSSTLAQMLSSTDGSTPPGLAPGAPTGSYTLTGFENVNLYNGNVNFNLPLLKIGGRGGAGMPVTVSLNSVKWTVEKETLSGTDGSSSCGIPDPDIQGCLYQPMTAPPGGGGEPYAFPNPELWNGLRVGYGPGVLQGRRTSNTQGPVTKSLIRLSFIAPGGTEYELRDKATNGRPYGAPGYGWQPPTDHGWVYTSEDGTITFSSDVQIIYDFGRGTSVIGPTRINGHLLLADGTRYRIENGLVMWMRDRNGNQMTFTYYGTTTSPLKERRVHTITDSLGRVTTIYYADTQYSYDRITFTGFGGTTTQEIRVYRKLLSQALRTTRTGDSTTTKTFGDLFLDLGNQGQVADTMYDPDDVISEIKLPDNRSYKLYYNVYNELARVELPTGGAIEYDYSPLGGGVYWAGAGPQIHRRLSERRVYADGTSGTYESRQTYSMTQTVTAYSGSYPTFWETTVEVKQYGASSLLSSAKHTFFWSPVASMYKAPVSYSGWKDGKEKKVEYFDAQGTPLRRVENTWQQCVQCELDMGWWTGSTSETSDHAPSNNPHIAETVTTLLDVTPNLVSKQTFEYDKYNNLTERDEYDYNPSVAATHPIRHTETDYLATSAYTDATVHIRNLPTMQRVYAVNPANGAETLAAKSETIYDQSTYQVTESYGTVTGYTTPGTAARGNATTSKAWYDVNSANAYIETHAQYDQCGNVRKSWDGKGKNSEIIYSADYHYALPTLVKTPKPDPFPSSASGSNVELETSRVYDFSTGLVTSTKDVNNNKTTYFEYNDALNRPTKVTKSDGGWTSFAYGDTVGNLFVQTQTALDAGRTLEAYQHFDGLGRAWRTSQTEGATSILVDTQYDELSRPWKVSNPYRTGESLQWITASYDAMGRVVAVASPDGAQVLTGYSGNTTTVTDQAGRKRKSVTDGLGRLTQVIEDPTGAFNYQTSYAYDALNNLRTVTQGEQTRTFVYDALSRLTSATNPESGNIAYSYDNNGNLQTKTDARGTTATYTYDALNRIITRSYSGGTAMATPTVSYVYDGAGVANSQGRLTSVSSSVSTYNYTGYEAMGRVTGSQQVTDRQTYSMSYSYDLAGNMTSQTYPTGRAITNNFDNTGRLSSINGQASGGTQKTYANSFAYAAHGAMKQVRLGNGRWEHTNYDPDRLQPLEIGLGTSGNDSSILKLEYNYGATDNNGNVKRQVITVPTIGTVAGFTATQHYQYDELNRLTGAQEVNGVSSAWQTSGQPLWQQCFTYDRFGNRSMDTANTDSTLIGPNPQISTSTNRIVPRTTPSLEYYEYDLTGNLKKGQGGDTFAYNGENKLVQYEGGSTQIGGANYFYDGDGRRVKKAKPSETLIFVYNILGQLVAEYTTSTPESNGTSYLTSDILGTPRAITEADGSIKARHDYLPFGEEIAAGVGGRTPSQGYSQLDGVRQHFTGKERDTETGLDYFLARYYSSAQ